MARRLLVQQHGRCQQAACSGYHHHNHNDAGYGSEDIDRGEAVKLTLPEWGFILLLAIASGLSFDARGEVVTADVPATTVPISIVCPSGAPSKLASNSWACGGVAPPQCPSPPGPGPCGGPISCPGFSNTILLEIPWINPPRTLTGFFGQNDIVVVKFTTGPSPSSGNLPKIAGAEFQGPPTQRTAALSATACDFNGLPYPGAVVPNSTSVTVNFTVDNPNNFGYYPILHTNTTYYFNVKNVAGQCSGNCSMAFDLIKYNNP
jgi:hypothetical protein